MTALSELDSSFIQSINALHSYEHLSGTGTPTLQLLLEEAILQKTGVGKDFTALVQSVMKQSNASEYRNLSSNVEDSKTTTSSSDNELELDLLKDDLMCVVCRQMVVGANNQLLECSDCHSLYHQDCHNPIITSKDVEGGHWICANCKEIKKAAKAEAKSHRSSSSSGYKSSSSKSGTSSSKSSSSGSSKHSSSNSSKHHSSSSSSSGTTHSSTNSLIISRNPTTPNINIISADKRIQIMKKKAASKIHEKRKPSSR